MSDSLVALLVVVIVLLCTLISIQILLAFYEQEVKNFLSRIRGTRKHREVTINELIIFFNNLASSLAKMSLEKTGALIIVENRDSLSAYINIGNKIDSAFFPEFVHNIFFNHKSALHDGAMIVRNWRIASLSSYLPMTKRIVNVEYGARHRAAFGICEKFDCFAFVVSETNGNITAVHHDEIKRLNQSPEKLVTEIAKIFVHSGAIDKSGSLKNVDIVEKVKEYTNIK